MYLIYDLLFLLYGLIYLPYLLLTRRGYAGFGMRFGIFSTPVKEHLKAGANIWMHAVSVGEVMVIDGFINRFKEKHPSYQLIVTVTTKAGYELACERLKGRALVLASPIDLSIVAGRFVSLIRPKMYIAVETEIWPNLYRQLHLQKVPIAVVNGRISDGSFGRYKAIRFLLKGVLNQVSLWCMQAQEHAARITALGAGSSRVKVTGNMKFDDLPQASTAINGLAAGKNELWWVAGSTHPGEEEIVLNVYRKIIKDDPRWRLVIAPRHIERAASIMELITRHGLKAIKFTEIASGERIGTLDTVMVVDTIGQLRSLYSLASLVFVGKSLCVGGGHNIIEPATYGKAIIIGPLVENFKDIVDCFKKADAIVQVDNLASFETAVAALCVDLTKREALGVAAREVIAANQGATRRCLGELAEFIK